MPTRHEARRRDREDRERREREAKLAEERRKKRYWFGVGGLLVVGLIAGAVVLVGSLSGGDGRRSATAGAGQGEAGHIHGLGVNPADGSLYIATHAGLYRAADGSTQTPRVGDSDRDLMGFSVVGPDHFVASGHPGSEPDLPANIGLAESRDGGKTWQPVSLLGEADFHVLRASGRRVYGYDGPNGRFMVSGDLGRNWSERPLPAAPFDLAVDPGDPDRVLAATEAGLHESRDAGRTWRTVSSQIGLLAWAAPGRLFVLTGDGRVHLSDDGGREARSRGRIQGEPVGFMATEDRLYVALADGTVLQSTDDGESFAVRALL